MTSPAVGRPEAKAERMSESGAGEGGREALDYVRYPIPMAWLEDGSGGRFTVRELAEQQASLLVFLSTTCKACVDVAGDVVHMAAESPFLGVHPVFSLEISPGAGGQR